MARAAFIHHMAVGPWGHLAPWRTELCCRFPLPSRRARAGPDRLHGRVCGHTAQYQTLLLRRADGQLPPLLAQIPLTVRLQMLALRFAEARGQDPDRVSTGAWDDPALWAIGPR